MKKNIKDYLHLYLGCEVFVQKKQGNESLVKGRICEVTNGSNHGDWIRVQFEHVVKFMYYNLDERSSNFHTFFIGEDHIKPILRPLSDMMEEERAEFGWQDDADFEELFKDGQISKNTYNAWMFPILLSKGFDLFGLIEAGLAIDKTKLLLKA